MSQHELPHTHGCFVCGESNSFGMQLRFHAHGDEVRTIFRPRPEHVGFKGVIHGGLLATVLDEILVWACAVPTGKFSFCAELTVRFVHPVQPLEELTVTARMTENKRGRLFLAEGRIENAGGVLCATAAGKYIPIPESKLMGVAEELIGGSGEFSPGRAAAGLIDPSSR